MTSFTLTELGNKSGEVIEAAIKAPVEITKRGKRKFVIMTAELYDRLARQAPQAYSIESAPEEIHRGLLQGLEDILAAADGDVDV